MSYDDDDPKRTLLSHVSLIWLGDFGTRVLVLVGQISGTTQPSLLKVRWACRTIVAQRPNMASGRLDNHNQKDPLGVIPSSLSGQDTNIIMGF